MTQHDEQPDHAELLARLDTRKVKHPQNWTEVGADQDCADAASAIRDLSAQLEAERIASNSGMAAQAELNRIVDYIMGYWPANFCYSNPLQAVTVLAAEMGRTQQRALAAESRLATVFERTRERAAKECESALNGTASTWPIRPRLAAAIRSLQPEGEKSEGKPK